MFERVARDLVTTGGWPFAATGWRIAATVTLIGAAVACSGGSPPETGPSAGRTDEPDDAAAAQGEIDQPEPQVTEPFSRTKSISCSVVKRPTLNRMALSAIS